MSVKQIMAGLALVRTSGDKFNTLVHDTAMLILHHANDHGDASFAQTLVMNMPASMRRTQLVLWFNKYSPIVTKHDDSAWKAKMIGKDSKLYRPFDIDGATATPWYELAKANAEPKTVTFLDLQLQPRKMAARITKLIEDGLIPDDDLLSAQQMIIVYESLTFNRVIPVEPKVEPEVATANAEAANEKTEEPASNEPA